MCVAQCRNCQPVAGPAVGTDLVKLCHAALCARHAGLLCCTASSHGIAQHSAFNQYWCHCVQGKRNLLWRCAPDGTPLEVRQLADSLPTKVAGEDSVLVDSPTVQTTTPVKACVLQHRQQAALHQNAQHKGFLVAAAFCSTGYHQSNVSIAQPVAHHGICLCQHKRLMCSTAGRAYLLVASACCVDTGNAQRPYNHCVRCCLPLPVRVPRHGRRPLQIPSCPGAKGRGLHQVQQAIFRGGLLLSQPTKHMASSSQQAWHLAEHQPAYLQLTLQQLFWVLQCKGP
jgi:hypothetical protein